MIKSQTRNASMFLLRRMSFFYTVPRLFKTITMARKPIVTPIFHRVYGSSCSPQGLGQSQHFCALGYRAVKRFIICLSTGILERWAQIMEVIIDILTCPC